MCDAARAVAHALDLHDHVERGGDLRAHRLGWQVVAGEADHVLQAGERLARTVGVQRAERAVVAGVHGLQHVDRLRAAHQPRSEEHTSELQSLMRISYAVFCLKKKNRQKKLTIQDQNRHLIITSTATAVTTE